MFHSICKPAAVLAACVFMLGCRQVQQAPATAAAEEANTALLADCVARYYKVNASAYVTQQTHRFIPAQGVLEVTAVEPTGRVEYSLRQNQFSANPGRAASSSDLPETFFNQALATAVFYGMCAGGSLLETEAMISEEPVKIEGQWYKPITPSWPKDQLSVTLLQNQDSKRIELVQVSEPSGVQWLARSSNLRYSRELQSRLPQTIDVFDVADGIASKKLIVRFEYKSFSTASASNRENASLSRE